MRSFGSGYILCLRKCGVIIRGVGMRWCNLWVDFVISWNILWHADSLRSLKYAKFTQSNTLHVKIYKFTFLETILFSETNTLTDVMLSDIRGHEILVYHIAKIHEIHITPSLTIEYRWVTNGTDGFRPKLKVYTDYERKFRQTYLTKPTRVC